MALAQIAEIRRRRLVQRSASLGRFLLSALAPLATRRSSPITSRQPLVNIRGLGLMAGLELCLPDGTPAAKLVMRIIKEMLHRGYIFLPEGEHGNVISFTPPLTISQSQLARCVNCLSRALSKILSLGHVA
jgi:4-aminobutyrate aminotransferase-like enzyme